MEHENNSKQLAEIMIGASRALGLAVDALEANPPDTEETSSEAYTVAHAAHLGHIALLLRARVDLITHANELLGKYRETLSEEVARLAELVKYLQNLKTQD